MPMKKLLLLPLSLMLVIPGLAQANPNLTRYAASTWCGARQRGESVKEANRQMRNAISSSMVMSSSDNFAGQLVGLLSSRKAMQSSIDYHIQQMCPGSVYSSSPVQSINTSPSTSSYCLRAPWDENCKSGYGPGKSSSNKKVCLKAIQKYDCKYTKYLEANPHMQDWVNSNPEMAIKEALRLQAVDADEIGAEAKQIEIATPQAEKVDAAETCLKAADYKGCMEYNKSN